MHRKWAFVLSVLTGLVTHAVAARDARVEDIVDLRQLQAIATSELSAKPSPESEALQRVTSRRNFAESLAALLTARKPLGSFDPANWNAISSDVCRIAGLGVGRCLSLPCLVPAINPETAKECPITTDLANAKPPPGDPTELSEWLEAIGKTDNQNRSIKPQLLRRELPIEPDIIAAKGILHAIWPDVLEAARGLSNVGPENVRFLLEEVAAKIQDRTQRGARIVAAGRIITKLPMEARSAFEPSGSRLVAIASKIEPLFQNVDPAKPAIVILPGHLSRDLADGEILIAAIGKRVTASIAEFTNKVMPARQPSIDGNACAAGPSQFHQLAERKFGDRTVGLAFRWLSQAVGSATSAELVLTLSADDDVTVSPTFVDKTGKVIAAETIKVPASCALSIFPLGITVNNLRRENERLIHTAEKDALTQSTDIDRFRSGLQEFLQQAAGVHGLPSTIRVGRARLTFSADFKTIDLLSDLTVPILNVTVPTTTSLVRDGVLVFEPNIKKIFDAENLPDKIGRGIAGSVEKSKVSIGSFNARIVKVKPAPQPHFEGGTWLAMDTELSFGATVVAKSAEVYLVERNQSVRVELAEDPTPLMRVVLNGILNNKSNQDGIRSALQLVMPEANSKPLLDAISEALLIERVRVSDDNDGVVVKLGFDLAALTGKADLPKTTREGPLDPNKSDLGIGNLYADLIKGALSNTADMSAVILSRITERFALKAQDAAAKAIDDAIRSIATAAKSALGIEVDFRKNQSSQEGALRITWTGDKFEIRNIAVIVTPQPRIDFAKAEISEADSRRLAEKLQTTLLKELKAVIGIAWTPCGTARLGRSSSGMIIELSAQAPIVGCLPLPAVVFDGAKLVVDLNRTVDSISPILVEKVKLLLPEEYRAYVIDARLEKGPSPKIRMMVNAPLPGTSVDLKGEISVNLSNGKLDIKVDTSGTIFSQILKSAAGLVGKDFMVEPVPGKLALRASANVDFGAFGVGVRGMELSPKRIHLPELLIKLPLAITIGPFTIWPIQIQAKLEKPVHVALIGDASFAALQAVFRIRATMGFEIPPSSIDMRGLMTVIEILDLFEVTGKIDFKENRATADSKTVGLLAAIMPAKQFMEIDSHHAIFESSMTLLVLDVKGNGEIRFTRNPEIEMSGSAKLLGLANLRADLKSDLELRRPAASIEGAVSLQPLGDIKFGAKGSSHNATVHASIIGISASLVLPSFGDLDGDLIKKLFEDLLKPSIDLKNVNLKNVKVSLSPRIGGGGDGAAPGKKGGDGAGKDGGGADSEGGAALPRGAAPASDKPPIVDPSNAVRTGTIPSEWQSGWLPSSEPGMFCKAEWKGPREIRWLSATRAPAEVIRVLANPARLSMDLGLSDAEVTYWNNCNEKLETRSGALALALFDGTGEPKIWNDGTRPLETASWISDVLKYFEAPEPALITEKNMPAAAAKAISIIYQARLSGNALQGLGKLRLADGRVMYRIAALGKIHVIDGTDPSAPVRSFRDDEVLGKWIGQITDNTDKPLAKLRETLLPLLFVGGEPRALSELEDRLLVLVSPFTAKPFVASFKLSDGLCGGQIPAPDVAKFSVDRRVGEPVIKALLSEGAVCASSSRWTKFFTVVDGGQLQRIVVARIGSNGDWALDFVDASGTPPCLRTRLSGTEMSALLDQWTSADLLSAQDKSVLAGSDNALDAVLESVLRPEIAWRVRFPLNPFLKSVCEGKP